MFQYRQVLVRLGQGDSDRDIESAGRDMGIMNMAHLSQLFAPGIAGVLILRFGHGALFALCMVAAAVGGVLVFRIRGAR